MKKNAPKVKSQKKKHLKTRQKYYMMTLKYRKEKLILEYEKKEKN